MTAALRVGLGAVACLVFGLAGATAFASRDRPGARWFVLLCVAFGLLSVTLAAPVEGTIGLLAVRLGAFELVTVAWLLFAITYTGRGPELSRPLLLGLAGFVILVITPILGVSLVPSARAGPLFAANFVLQSLWFALGAYGLLVAGRSVLAYDDLPTGGTLLVSTIGGGLVSLAIVFVITSAGAQLTGLKISLAVLSLVGVALLVVVRRYEPFTTGGSAGHLARERVLEEMDAAVVIVDRRNEVLDCNGAFESTFGVEWREVVGRRLDAVVEGLADGDDVRLSTTDGTRACDVQRTTLTGHAGAPIGEAYRIRDVSDRRTREQRLDVLNRVLRHNLRNGLDAIHAFAETLEADPAAVDSSEIGPRIRDTAADLSDIGATVARVERLLGDDQRDTTRVDAVVLAREVLEEVTDHHPGTGAVSAGGPVPIETDAELLAAALTEVVENGFEHGPDEDTRVAVDVERSADGARIVVRDNGPGIPDRERAVLVDGAEEPLRHGSGVGLWFVNWGLSRLGGELQVSAGDPAGSVVTLVVPDLADDA